MLQDALEPDDLLFVEPRLNGACPDFVVVRRGHGALVIEVKDFVRKKYTIPKNVEKDWRSSRTGRAYRSPFKQVQRYKTRFYDEEVPRLGMHRALDENWFALVTAAVYFHGWGPKELMDVRHKHVPAFGRLEVERLREWLGQKWRRRDWFDDAYFDSFRAALKDKQHQAHEGRTVPFSAAQKALVTSQAGARRKVRGVAGSGKTLVLAHRAVHAYRRHGNDVLVLTYNHALVHRMREHLGSVPEAFPWSRFTIDTYHAFLSTMANEVGAPLGDVLKAADDLDVLAGFEDRTPRYHSILIDEVQDWKEVWLRIIVRYFLVEGGDVYVTGDEKQNMYGHPELDAQKFPVIPETPGRWKRLGACFRTDARGVQTLLRFQRSFLTSYPMEQVVTGQQLALLRPSELAVEYVGVPDWHAGVDAVTRVLGAVSEEEVTGDLVVLGRAVGTLRVLSKKVGRGTTRTFESAEEHEKLRGLLKACTCKTRQPGGPKCKLCPALGGLRKIYRRVFRMNTGKLKISTVQSFKGWEADTVLFLLDQTDAGPAFLDELVYTALTRARRRFVMVEVGTERYRTFFTTPS